MSKLIAVVVMFFTLGLAFFMDLGAVAMGKLVETQANANPYVLPVMFYNVVMVALWLLLAWLILVRSGRSLLLSAFIVIITFGIAFLLPLAIVSRFIPAYKLGRDFTNGILFPMIASGPRSYLTISATYILGLGIVNLFRRRPA